MAVKRARARRNPPPQIGVVPLKKRKLVTHIDSDILESSDGVSWKRVSYLGKGGFGSVYLAMTNLLSQVRHSFPSQIAVKSVAMSKSFSLQYEKLVLCRLNESPFVIHCYGEQVTETSKGEKLYNILLEYCSGLSLDHQIKKMEGLPESIVRDYTRDVVRGLKYIHDQGYAHCDIKPCNILLAPSSTSRCGFVAKIADLGLAKEMDDEWDDGLPEIRGTYRYMSPELIKEKRVDYPVDIWALGCSVVEMLSGKPVWNFSDVEELMQVVGYSNQAPELPSDLHDVVSTDCKDFLSKCLVKNVAERWTADMLQKHPFLAEK